MKVCEKCGEEIATKDGENVCQNCDEGRKKRNKLSKKLREQILRDLGLVKVRGSLGGTYWE